MPKVLFVDSDPFTLIDDAEYPSNLTSWKDKKTQKNDPMITVEYTLQDQNGRKLWQNYTLTEKSMWSFKRDMITAGADPDLFVDAAELDTDEVLESVKDNEVILVVGHEDAKDKNGEVIMDKEGKPKQRNIILQVKESEGY